MDFKAAWSPEAVEDVESIAEYIGKDSAFYANSVISGITDLTGSLGEFPLIGRVVPELNDESIRERFAYNFRIIYRVEKERILVLAIVHGKRLLFESIGERFS
jgi:plasmid stabilization system protein ParE